MNIKSYKCKYGHIDNRFLDSRGQLQCKPCSLATQKRWAINNPERVKEIRRKSGSIVFFGNNREKVILRDKEKCVECNMTREDHREKYGRDITVNHIDGRGINTPRPEKNNIMDNLETLCMKCHGIKDSKRKTIHSNKYIKLRELTIRTA